MVRHNTAVNVITVDNLEGDDRNTAIKEVKHYNERVSFPTTVIGGEVIVGYKADQIKKALEGN